MHKYPYVFMCFLMYQHIALPGSGSRGPGLPRNDFRACPLWRARFRHPPRTTTKGFAPRRLPTLPGRGASSRDVSGQIPAQNLFVHFVLRSARSSSYCEVHGAVRTAKCTEQFVLRSARSSSVLQVHSAASFPK
jgi:hypothetical protein